MIRSLWTRKKSDMVGMALAERQTHSYHHYVRLGFCDQYHHLRKQACIDPEACCRCSLIMSAVSETSTPVSKQASKWRWQTPAGADFVQVTEFMGLVAGRSLQYYSYAGEQWMKCRALWRHASSARNAAPLHAAACAVAFEKQNPS